MGARAPAAAAAAPQKRVRPATARRSAPSSRPPPPTTTTTRTYIVALAWLGDYKEALEQAVQCYQVSKDAQSVSDEKTLKAQHLRARLLWENGQKDAAIEVEDSCFNLRKEALGLQHPDTLDSVDALAKYIAQRSPDKSKKLRLDHHKFMVKSLGKGHTKTLEFERRMTETGTPSDRRSFLKALTSTL
mmetsp:Transcript_7679/g.28137  ORF Transcript_7679/g.28137 Transcript_7679/m.28137 type:complete len:188 (+) Transcript_7679:164-727(+)